MWRSTDRFVCTSWLLCAGACMPDIPAQAPHSFVEFQFDPGPADKTFQPTSLVINSSTGLIDLSMAGISVPPSDHPSACAEQTALTVAQCEFYQYLQQLDGFPTLAGGQTPLSTAVDLSTVTLPDNLFVYDLNHQEMVDDIDVSFDAQSSTLHFDPSAGWNVGGSYVIGLRGYAHGIKSTHGDPSVASTIYVLLKSESSLTCGVTSPDAIDAGCEYYQLFSSDAMFAELSPSARHAAVGANLLQLEQLRQYYRGEDPYAPADLWKTLAGAGNLPKAEVAIGWFFPTHSASVVELNPQLGMVPHIISSREIRVAVKGNLRAETLRAFSLQDPAGNVFLLDVDKLVKNAVDPEALPPFSATYVDGQIVLTATDPKYPFIDGDNYAVLLTSELTDVDGKPLVASPVTVFLRTRGALVDGNGKSQLDGVSDADAAELEQGRAQFAQLLDDPLIQSATISDARPSGLTREQLVYLYAFPFVSP